ncbi:MAG TPA: flagellar basal body rod protein FlgB [Chitinispirillaceae bacterium]|jgi:flagellar basal-body rod protein FlgB|nr:flagellar basal body rod protein FlgB [Chitinispirillaceae bacterium]
MLGEMLSRTNLPLMQKMMDTAMLRGRVIANNIANVNTPGYRRVEVAFEEALRSALDRTKLKGARTDEKHLAMGRKDISGVNAEAYHPYDPTLPSGVNNVDIDMEMAKLAETQLAYNYAVRLGQGVFKKLNAAIQGKSLQ